METIKLTNGVEMPLLGYGVFLVPPQEAEHRLTIMKRAWVLPSRRAV